MEDAGARSVGAALHPDLRDQIRTLRSVFLADRRALRHGRFCRLRFGLLVLAKEGLHGDRSLIGGGKPLDPVGDLRVRRRFAGVAVLLQPGRDLIRIAVLPADARLEGIVQRKLVRQAPTAAAVCRAGVEAGERELVRKQILCLRDHVLRDGLVAKEEGIVRAEIVLGFDRRVQQPVEPAVLFRTGFGAGLPVGLGDFRRRSGLFRQVGGGLGRLFRRRPGRRSCFFRCGRCSRGYLLRRDFSGQICFFRRGLGVPAPLPLRRFGGLSRRRLSRLRRHGEQFVQRGKRVACHGAARRRARAGQRECPGVAVCRPLSRPGGDLPGRLHGISRRSGRLRLGRVLRSLWRRLRRFCRCVRAGICFLIAGAESSARKQTVHGGKELVVRPAVSALCGLCPGIPGLRHFRGRGGSWL